MYGWYGNGMNDGGAVMWIVMVMFLAVVVLGVVALLRSNVAGRVHLPPVGDSSSVTILKERFARGEIGEEEFRQRMDALGRSR